MKIVLLLVTVMQFYNCYSQDTINVGKKPNVNGYPYGCTFLALHKPGDSVYYATKKLDTVIFAKFLGPYSAIAIGYRKSTINNLWIAKYKTGVIKEIGRFYKSKRKYFTIRKVGTWLYFSEGGKLINKIYHPGETSLSSL